MNSLKKITLYTQFLIFYTMVVILWGAWVRISNSGDGCGESWPLCHEQFIPQTDHVATWVEFSHRLTSGLYGILILVLFIWVFKKSNLKHLRVAAFLTLLLTITEALLGARLVLAGLVGDNASLARAYTMGLHLVNSMLLMGSLVLTYHFSVFQRPANRPLLKWQKTLAVAAVVIFLFIGVTGAFAALSTTLFPSESLITGLADDFASDSHFLVKLRVSHPLGALILGGLLIAVAQFFYRFDHKDTVLKYRAKILRRYTVLGIIFGIITLMSLSPTALKLIHLTWAYVIWIFLVLTVTRFYYRA